MMKDSDRIAVTGMGVVSPIGIGVDAFHQGLTEGRDGITDLEFPWETGTKANRAGAVKGFDLANFVPDQPRMGRASQLAVAAAAEALHRSGYDVDPAEADRFGAVIGTAMGDVTEFEEDWQEYRRSGASAPDGRSRQWMRLGNMGDRISEVLGLDGPNHTLAAACAAGNHAIAMSADLLKNGSANAMLAVGADVISFVDMLGFNRLMLQAPERCQPFDLNRKGTIVAEGSAALVLERLEDATRRGARILAELTGYGISCDAGGAFASSLKDTRGMRMAFKRAVRSAQMSPQETDHVNMHGTGTKLNDKKETRFLKEVLGDHAYQVPINSIKSMIGHTQGAAPLLEAVACVLTLEHDVIYPTTNYETPDPACDLDCVTNQPREIRVNTIVSNSFGIGGNNAIVIFKRWKGQ